MRLKFELGWIGKPTLLENESQGSFLREDSEGVSRWLLELDVTQLLGEVTDGDGDAGLGEGWRLLCKKAHHAVELGRDLEWKEDLGSELNVDSLDTRYVPESSSRSTQAPSKRNGRRSLLQCRSRAPRRARPSTSRHPPVAASSSRHPAPRACRPGSLPPIDPRHPPLRT